MSYEAAFDDIYNIITQVAEDVGLQCRRSDKRHDSGPILQQIVEDIHRADVVVADLTNNNPNVLFEIGVAYQLKNIGQVVLLTQRDGDVPFDLQGHRYLKYEHHTEGRHSLSLELRRYLERATSETDRETWEPIKGRHERTLRIIADLKAMAAVRKDTANVSELTIRVIAGLSSVAISNNEPRQPGSENTEYHSLLIRERNALRELLLSGANLQAVLIPPTTYSSARDWRCLDCRYRRLIGLLQGNSDNGVPADVEADIAMIERCRFVISEVPHPNTLILDDSVAYEGIKRGIGRGFGLTYRITIREEIAESVSEFDNLYRDAYEYTLRDSEDLRQATLTHLKAAHEQYLSTCPLLDDFPTEEK